MPRYKKRCSKQRPKVKLQRTKLIREYLKRQGYAVQSLRRLKKRGHVGTHTSLGKTQGGEDRTSKENVEFNREKAAGFAAGSTRR